MPSRILSNNGESFTIQAVGLKPGGWYSLKVGAETSAGASATGNYALTAQFGTTAATLDTFAEATDVPAGATRSTTLYVGETQLMNFVLGVDLPKGTVIPGVSSVEMTIIDSAGRVVFRLKGAAGDTVSGPALLLTPGAYRLVFAVAGPIGSSLSIRLMGSEISDPIGPVLTDPSLTPIYTIPTTPGWFNYPGGIRTTAPFLILPILPG